MRDDFDDQDKPNRKDVWDRVPQVEMDLSRSEVVHLALQERFSSAKALHWERAKDGKIGWAWDGPRALAVLVHRT
jgi:hypothetical protein